MYNIPNEVQIGTLRVSLLCEHWCSVLPTDSTGAFFGYIYILIEHLLHSQTEIFLFVFFKTVLLKDFIFENVRIMIHFSVDMYANRYILCFLF